jgi:hypothetical protein
MMSQSGKLATGSVPPGSAVQTLTGNTGGPVGPDGVGNINVVGVNVITVDGNPGTFTETISLINGTNGQLLIGGGVQPTWANLTSTGGTVLITNGPNSINLETSSGSLRTDFTVSGMWTKDARTKFVTIFAWNGGQGGASGRQGASASAGGGGGGGCGGCFIYSADASFFDANETVTIGAGGAGGATQASMNTNGNPGGSAGQTSFGNLSCPIGTNVSAGGNNTGAAAAGNAGGFALPTSPWGDEGPGSGNGQLVAGSNAQNSNATVLSESEPISITSLSGGGGGGANSVTERAGGDGGNLFNFAAGVNPTYTLLLAGGAGGIESGTINGGNGNAGFITTGGFLSGGTGGGGGGGQSVGVVAGNGGNGGFPGGGGGGGGGSLNGTSSGAGGDGGDGLVIVIEYF